ncbi:MAG: TIGR03564 family F420-dependent LLM class oxidoreductase [Gammaproteobacteria bacterium]|nr:MAG: TIGR03564 family F420-dependent LLM class oxidoreductase [Gammaproteobacteria bacterium]
MRIGIMIGTDMAQPTLDELIARARTAEAAGLHQVWMANMFSFDALTTLALVGRETSRIGLGTAVTPTFPRHPTVMAQQAMTAAAASNGRFTLGIGLSHRLVIEDMFGLSYARPARHMREYLSVLLPLLRGETVAFNGEFYRVNGVTLDFPGGHNPPIVIAALGPVMLRLAAELSEGTSTWMVGPKTMENHIIRSLREAGMQAPRVVGGFPVLLTNRPDEVRAELGAALTIYGQLPSYRAMLDREGLARPEDVAILGDEKLLRSAIRRLADIGVTDFNAVIMGSDPEDCARTLQFLADVAGRGA